MTVEPARARCLCGAVGAAMPAMPIFVIACHCTACQARSGGPFGAGAYFAVDDVVLVGEVREYARATDSGGWLRNRFCPTCGVTVHWIIDRRPDLIGIAFGTITGLAPDAPLHSLYERSRHDWARLDDAAVHCEAGHPA